MGRVLVVDDDADVRAGLKMLLEDDGHSVVELDDGLRVPEIINEHGVDVILLDLSMPRVDGFEVLSMLLLEPRMAAIPVIVVSARGRPNDRAQAMALGACEYVNKPWGDGEVEFRVRIALGKSEKKWAEESKTPANGSLETSSPKPEANSIATPEPIKPSPVTNVTREAAPAPVTPQRATQPAPQNGKSEKKWADESKAPADESRENGSPKPDATPVAAPESSKAADVTKQRPSAPVAPERSARPAPQDGKTDPSPQEPESSDQATRPVRRRSRVRRVVRRTTRRRAA